MSASHKKMLRREENQAAMTERQQQEQKEAKKLRLYTATFVAVIVLLVAVFVVTTFMRSGIVERNTTALTVNDSKISAVELNYYYIDSVNSFMNANGSYASMIGLDTTLALDQQFYNEEAGQTWADYLLDVATQNASYSYSLYQDAQANGYTLSETAQESVDSNLASLESYATLYGYSNMDGYLKAMYGPGSNEETYREYMTVQVTAQDYYNATLDSMEYSDADLRAAEEENYNAYSSYTYDYYYLPVSSFLVGGTTDEETGETTYTDEEQATAETLCKQTAEMLETAPSLDELNEQLAVIASDLDLGSTAAMNMSDTLYTNIDTKIAEWLASEDRKEGDIGCIESTSTSTDEDGNEVVTVNGYYIVHYVSQTDNTFPLVNVRHILLEHEGGTTDEETGSITYSDEEKAATLARAEELLNTFTSGEATEDAFATLANENSTDTGSNTNGGLYENVYPGQMVDSFNDWCFDESRQPGDTGIVESDYGYHIMYFSGNADTTYRDYMITNELLSADMTEWESSIVDAATMELVDDSNVNKSLMVNVGTE